MADLSYFVKPYEISQAITLLGGQETLSNLLSAVNANIANELPFQCPKCVYIRNSYQISGTYQQRKTVGYRLFALTKGCVI